MNSFGDWVYSPQTFMHRLHAKTTVFLKLKYSFLCDKLINVEIRGLFCFLMNVQSKYTNIGTNIRKSKITRNEQFDYS